MQKIQLTIPEPCHENWHQMTPTDQGRFCNSCAKEVVDFTMMTDTEVLNYFTTVAHEKICGSALPSQLNRNISQPKEPKKRLFWYWNYLVMFFLFLGKMNVTKAQIKVKSNTQLSPVNSINIRGEISSAPLPGAHQKQFTADKLTNIDADSLKDLQIRSTKIAQTGAETRVRLGEMSVDKKGNGALYVVDGKIVLDSKDINPDDIDDVAVLQGPAAMALFGKEGADGAIIITTRKAKTKNMDTVTVFAYEHTRGKMVCRSTTTSVMGATIAGVQVKNSVADSLKIIATKITGAIKIYPNPVQADKLFNIALKLKQTGRHRIMINDAAGRIFLQQEINAVTKEFREEIIADMRWSKGIYYVSVFNSRNQLVNKTSFIFQ